jgi:GNAT superfamily N-acetyltransferase
METTHHPWQPLESEDLATLGQIATQIHPGLPERLEVLAEKNSLFPAGCRKLVVADKMTGYGLCHPWKLHSIPALDQFIGHLPADADCLFLHDVVVRPEARGRGAAESYLRYVQSLATTVGFRTLALVSVYGSNALWERFGFKPCMHSGLEAKLALYGSSSIYMTLGLGCRCGQPGRTASITRRPTYGS